MAKKKQQQDDDPTVRHLKGGKPEYPEGTHPPVPPSDQTWGPGRLEYSDMPDEDKPDESTVANVVEPDPIQEDVQEALAESADQSADQSAEQPPQ